MTSNATFPTNQITDTPCLGFVSEPPETDRHGPHIGNSYGELRIHQKQQESPEEMVYSRILEIVCCIAVGGGFER